MESAKPFFQQYRRHFAIYRYIGHLLGCDCLETGLSQRKISRHGHIVITSVNVTR